MRAIANSMHHVINIAKILIHFSNFIHPWYRNMSYLVMAVAVEGKSSIIIIPCHLL